MKPQSLLFGSALIAGLALHASGAQAIIRDDLSGDIQMVQSALTAPGNSDDVEDFDTTKQIWSWSSKSWGNARFGASYSAQGVTAAWRPGISMAQNFFRTTATAFGDTRDVVVGSISAETDGPGQTATVQGVIWVLGNAVRDVTRTGGDFTVAATKITSFSQKVYDTGKQTFWIGPVRIAVGASVNAIAGQSVFGHVWTDGIDATLSQSAGLSVTAFGGPDYWLFAGGIKVKDLSLLNASLELASKGRYEMLGAASGGCAAEYTIGHTYGVRLQELSGQIVAWGRFATFYDEYQIFDPFTGFVQFFPIDNVAPFARTFGGCFAVPEAPQIPGYIIG